MVQSGGPLPETLIVIILLRWFAEGLVFVEEVYSSINSLKALNPNRDFTDQNSVLLWDNNNNNSYDEMITDMELTIRGSEDKDSRLTETEPQTISMAEEDIIEDENQDNEASEFRVEVPSTTQGCTGFSINKTFIWNTWQFSFVITECCKNHFIIIFV